MQRRIIEQLQTQVSNLAERLFANEPQEQSASNLQSAAQKVEFMKPNARAMRIMSKSRSGRGLR